MGEKGEKEGADFDDIETKRRTGHSSHITTPSNISIELNPSVSKEDANYIVTKAPRLTLEDEGVRRGSAMPVDDIPQTSFRLTTGGQGMRRGSVIPYKDIGVATL